MAGIPQPTAPPLRFGVYEFDPRARELHKNGSKVRLEGQPLQVLRLLLESAGEVVTREQLRQELWPAHTYVDFEHSINAAVKRLREALHDSAENPRFIETLPRRGYRFIYPLNGERENGERPEATADRSWWRSRVLPVAPLALLGCLGIAVALHPGRPRAGEAQAGAPTKPTSVAVLPLEDLSPGVREDYFADGMTEELITELSKIEGITVISRGSVMQYKGTRKPLAQVADELGANTVIEGSVAREGKRVRVTVQLTDVASKAQLWGERYERDLTSVLALQNEIAWQVAHEVRLPDHRDATQIAKGKAVDPRAYELYLKGRYLQSKWSTPENVKKAIEFYDQAIEKDESFAAAHAARGFAYLFLAAGLIEANRPVEVTSQARASASRALQLDPTSAEAYEDLGWVAQYYDWQWEAAERSYRRAIQLKPSYAPPYLWLAQYMNTMGRHTEAIVLAQRARALDPVSPHVQWSLAETYMLAGDLDRAAEQCRQGLKVHPDFWPLQTLRGNIYLRQKKFDAAIEALQKGAALSKDHPYALGALGSGYALSGRRSQALKIVVQLEQLSKHRYLSPPVMVRLHASLGQNREAVAWLNKACEDRSPEAARLRLWGPAMGTLESEPAFQEIVQRMHLSPAKG